MPRLENRLAPCPAGRPPNALAIFPPEGTISPGNFYKKYDGMKILAPIILSVTLVAALLSASRMAVAQKAPRKILFFSKSSGFEHDMIKRQDGQPSKAEKILSELGEKNNIEFTFTKDGGVFTPENIAKYDAFFFYTTGDLTEPGIGQEPAHVQGRQGRASSKPSPTARDSSAPTAPRTPFIPRAAESAIRPATKTMRADIDPYIKMIGAEFIIHGSQQRARQICVDKNFPGMSAVPDDFGPLEEWYSLKIFRLICMCFWCRTPPIWTIVRRQQTRL